MSAEVRKLELLQGDGYTVACDDVLETAKGRLQQVVLVGIDQAGDLLVAGSEGAPMAVFLLERAKAFLVGSEVKRA